jgi:ATP synthase F1 gamma subunit
MTRSAATAKSDQGSEGRFKAERGERLNYAESVDIRRRIRSVKNTQQLTKAMKTVSAAKLRRAQERVLSARPYADQLKRVLGNLTTRIESVSHPLLEVRPEEKYCS